LRYKAGRPKLADDPFTIRGCEPIGLRRSTPAVTLCDVLG
jgi:hypothetical protein